MCANLRCLLVRLPRYPECGSVSVALLGFRTREGNDGFAFFCHVATATLLPWVYKHNRGDLLAVSSLGSNVMGFEMINRIP